MSKIVVGLLCELALFGLVVYAVRKQPRAFFLRPFIVISLFGTTVEILSLCSKQALFGLPRITNIYTYPLFTLAECWCMLWLVSYFTTERKVLIASGAIFTALWIVAKQSIEPLSRFNTATGKMEYPVDSTTFSLLSLLTLVSLGFAARRILEPAIKNQKFGGLAWIFAGFASYSFLSLTIPALRPIFIDDIKVKIWWINTAAFAIKCACIGWGLLRIARTGNIAPLPEKKVLTKDFTVLDLGMIALFAIKYFFFYDSIAEFAGMVLLCSFGIIFYYVVALVRAGNELYIEERAQRKMEEQIARAEKATIESTLDDLATSVALIRSYLDEGVENATRESQTALEVLRLRLNPHIDRIIFACLKLMQKKPGKN